MNRKYSDDELLSLRLDPKKIPAWKETIKQTIDDFSIISIEKYLYSLKTVLNATVSAPEKLGSLLKEKLFFQRFFGDATEEEMVKLNKWTRKLDSSKLMYSSCDTSAPHFAQHGIQVDLHYLLYLEIQSTNHEIEKVEKILKNHSSQKDIISIKTPKEQLILLKERYRALQMYRVDVDSIQLAIKFIDEIYAKSKSTLFLIRQLEERIALAELKQAAILRFEQRHGNSLAIADATLEKARKRADRLRKLVKRTSHCPYCSIELDDSAQFDHIYPVSEGGLSTVKNMIWCCSACNSVKSNKGLITFLQERRLPVSEVFARLKSLGKHV